MNRWHASTSPLAKKMSFLMLMRFLCLQRGCMCSAC